MKRPDDWLKALELLAWRFSGLGVGPDLAGMTTTALAALYVRLTRLAVGAV